MMDDKLTEAQIHSACLSFRHDYGLMTEEERRKLRRDCRDWHEALSKELRPERGEVVTREAIGDAFHKAKFDAETDYRPQPTEIGLDAIYALQLPAPVVAVPSVEQGEGTS
ncbi:hypothetical protein [Tetrasphaera phage TJE1]|uniref:Uncharacterized protein n=1 Tax=Tetrasphaera phage TJE1 TaxID=981335 RepID=G4W939_9CAUD|nr:hypothetical protein G185_gp13 [Tetrasphaera phage TJE1]ADX42527.1 hypothetical protein [Tetrasphaera phage TJE1]